MLLMAWRSPAFVWAILMLQLSDRGTRMQDHAWLLMAHLDRNVTLSGIWELALDLGPGRQQTDLLLNVL